MNVRGVADRAVSITRRRSARRVPGPRDRWLPLEGPPGDRMPGIDDPSADLVVPSGRSGPATVLARFLAAAEASPPVPEGVLDLVDLRCDTATLAGVTGGALRGRRGRPLNGAGGLLDLSLPGRGGRPRRVLEVDGPVAVLDLRARSAENFFHLHVDALTNRWLVDRVDVGPPPVRWLLPAGPSAWQAEAIALAGLADEVLLLSAADRVLAPRFLVPVRGLGSRSVPAWTVAALRAVGGPPPDGAGLPRLLHVSRVDAPRRRMRGEDRLAIDLSDRGFTSIAPSTLTVTEQRRRFAAADVIVAAHGAALTSLAWARPGAVVVELLPAARPNLAFRRLAHQAGLRHVGLVCPPAGDGTDPHGDADLDVGAAVRLVEGILAGG